MNETSIIKNNRILVIDDNPAIHEDIRKILGSHSVTNDTTFNDAKRLLFGGAKTESNQAEFEIDSAFQGQEGLARVQRAIKEGRPYAVAFVDVRMPPGWDGVETIKRLWEECPDLQIVICTAYSDYSWEQMTRQLGKSDNMLVLKKPFDNVEVMQLAHALTEKWSLNNQLKCRLNDLDQMVGQRTSELRSANVKLKDEITERMQTEKALRLSEERFSKAFKASPIPLAMQSLKQERFVDANQGYLQLTGFSREQMIGRTPAELNIWVDPNEGKLIFKTLYSEMSVRNRPCRLRTRTGQLREILLSVELFELDGEPFLLTIAQDISEQVILENQLRQSQKMEAVGQLAAGVAHDFNNILTVIQGNAGLLLAARSPESSECKPLKTICGASERAGKLVRQLLTFSRKQYLQIHPLDIRDTLNTVSEMLPRMLGEHIRVEVIVAPDLPLINADSGMMEQMLVNLAVNARDAMFEGGRLTIRVEVVQIQPDAVRLNPDARPGPFVRMSVSDTGCGIPPEILPRIFEPFFTTKAVGKGTGLGLATVYGIAKQHQGWIEVQSQPGQGSTFTAFVPVCEKEPVPAAEHANDGTTHITAQTLKGGHETILVAEDEEDVRDFVVEVLKSYGYTVLHANSGVDALELWSQRTQDIDLLLTDMVMPGGVMGRELADRLVALKPQLKVVYTSGYSPGMAGADLMVLEKKTFLAKPFGPAKLLQKVRSTLDGVDADIHGM